MNDIVLAYKPVHEVTLKILCSLFQETRDMVWFILIQENAIKTLT